jgi:hypothetical protein
MYGGGELWCISRMFSVEVVLCDGFIGKKEALIESTTTKPLAQRVDFDPRPFEVNRPVHFTACVAVYVIFVNWNQFSFDAPLLSALEIAVFAAS